jgi:hypothetical protein
MKKLVLVVLVASSAAQAYEPLVLNCFVSCINPWSCPIGGWMLARLRSTSLMMPTPFIFMIGRANN